MHLFVVDADFSSLTTCKILYFNTLYYNFNKNELRAIGKYVAAVKKRKT